MRADVGYRDTPTFEKCLSKSMKLKGMQESYINREASLLKLLTTFCLFFSSSFWSMTPSNAEPILQSVSSRFSINFNESLKKATLLSEKSWEVKALSQYTKCVKNRVEMLRVVNRNNFIDCRTMRIE